MVLRLERDAWSMVPNRQITKASNKLVPPPAPHRLVFPPYDMPDVHLHQVSSSTCFTYLHRLIVVFFFSRSPLSPPPALLLDIAP